MAMHATLRSNHHPDAREAISFKAGERVQPGLPDPDWPEYIEATDPSGRRGRVPRDRLDGDVARADFDGRELSANAGDHVLLLELAGGWWWARNDIDETGWLPEYKLQFDPGAQ